MKLNIKQSKVIDYKGIILLGTFLLLVLSVPVFAQDEQEEAQEEPKAKEKPARDAFESAWWFDGQTGKVYNKGTLEMSMNHRFGTIKSGNNDLLGIYGAANIRLGLGYAPVDRLNIGFGYTKNKRILDLTAKVAVLRQTRSNSIPLSITYYGNWGSELLPEENYVNTTDRFSFYNQIIIFRRFNKMVSAQIGPSYTHYNAVMWEQQDDLTWEHMNNDTWGINIGVRLKVSSSTIIMLGYDQPLTQHPINQPKPSINVGVEIATSSHAFQVFFTNYDKIQPQENYMFNQNDFTKTGEGSVWLIGFNITRLWSF